jgi:hypothetical protein
MAEVTFTLGNAEFPNYATIIVTEGDYVGGAGQDLRFKIWIDPAAPAPQPLGDLLGVFFDLPYDASLITVHDENGNLVGTTPGDSTLPWLLPTGGAGNINMNGEFQDYFNDATHDLAVQVGTQGSTDGFLRGVKLYLSGGLADLDLSDFSGQDFLGIRVQSVGVDDASLKLAADIPGCGCQPPPPDEFCFDGLSQGFWAQHAKDVYNKNGKLVQKNAWDDGFGATAAFDFTFGVNGFGAALNDKTLLQAITSNGGGEAALARQAVASLLNSVSGNDGLVADFRYETSEIVDAVQFVYNGGSFNINSDQDSDGVADWLELKDELEFWNTAHDQAGYEAGEGLCIEVPHGTTPQGLLAKLGWDAMV